MAVLFAWNTHGMSHGADIRLAGKRARSGLLPLQFRQKVKKGCAHSAWRLPGHHAICVMPARSLQPRKIVRQSKADGFHLVADVGLARLCAGLLSGCKSGSESGVKKRCITD
jgi:hypothetical protein